MKRLLPLVLALLILTACGAPALEPSPSAAPVETSASTSSPGQITYDPTNDTPAPWPEFVAGPAEGGYTFRSDELGFSFTVPAEVSDRVGVSKGVRFSDPDGPSFTVFYVPENGRYPITMYYITVESPRSNFFSPKTWYYGSRSATIIQAMSEQSAYLMPGEIGGSEMNIVDPLFDDYYEVGQILYPAIERSFTVDDPSSVPELDTAALPVKSGELEAKGNATMTRAEAAQLAFNLLSAENKDKEYPLKYTDVASDSEYEHAIAYLDSYGMLTRYSRDGDDLDGDKFRPDEAITRAEFAMLLYRLSFDTYPQVYGDSLENIDYETWYSPYVNYAWRCGWYELDENGDIRADDPVTAAEAAHALSIVDEFGYPTPGVDF